jgi:NADH-quinone oxidoreductase subunit C
MLGELKNDFATLETVAIIATDYRVKGYHLDVEVGPEQVAAAAELLDRCGFFLEAVTGVDWLGKTPVGNQVVVAAEPEAAGAGESAAAALPPGPEKTGAQLEVVYDFNRTVGELCRVVVRCRLPRATPEIPTISRIIPGANWHERETHDFFGIIFTGHPDLSPLLLPEDADFHPLLKDFKA